MSQDLPECPRSSQNVPGSPKTFPEHLASREGKTTAIIGDGSRQRLEISRPRIILDLLQQRAKAEAEWKLLRQEEAASSFSVIEIFSPSPNPIPSERELIGCRRRAWPHQPSIPGDGRLGDISGFKKSLFQNLLKDNLKKKGPKNLWLKLSLGAERSLNYFNTQSVGSSSWLAPISEIS